MSQITYYVNSLDVSLEIVSQTVSIRKKLTSHASTATFVMINPTNAPVEGNDVKLYFDTFVIFAGIIDSVAFSYAAPPNIARYTCYCSDYRRLLDRRLVSENYAAGTTINNVLNGANGIVTKYTSGFSTVGWALGDTITLQNDLIIDYRVVGNALIELINVVEGMGLWGGSTEFYVDENKVIHVFYSFEGGPSPYDITDNTLQSIFHDFNIMCDYTQVRNSVLIKGGYKLTAVPETFTREADGVSREWILPYYPHNILLTVNGISQDPVGVENVDPDDGTFTYFYNYYEKNVKCAALTATPAAGVIILINMKYETPVLIRKEDAVSINTISANEGGDGIYEYVYKDSSIASTTEAIARANAELIRSANPVITGSVQTELAEFSVANPPFKEGQRIRVNITGFRYNGWYTIDNLEIDSLGNNILLWTANFNGKLVIPV